MPWFVRHQAALYWVAATAAVAANWRLREVWASRPRRFLAGAAGLGGAGVYLIFRPFLGTLEDTSKAYWWSLTILLPLVAIALWRPQLKQRYDVEIIEHLHLIGDYYR